MTNNKGKAGINVGVDVGKSQLDFYLWERHKHFTASNDEHGIKGALKVLRRYKIECIAMEATGRYEMAFASAAFEKDLPVAIVRPVLVRQFARAADQLAKTDKIDAAIIARFAAVMNPRLTAQRSKNLLLVKDLVTRRRQLINMRTQESNRAKVMGKGNRSFM